MWGAPSFKVCIWFPLQIAMAETWAEYLVGKMGIRASPDHIHLLCWEVLVYCLEIAWLPDGPMHPVIAKVIARTR